VPPKKGRFIFAYNLIKEQRILIRSGLQHKKILNYQMRIQILNSNILLTLLCTITGTVLASVFFPSFKLHRACFCEIYACFSAFWKLAVGNNNTKNTRKYNMTIYAALAIYSKRVSVGRLNTSLLSQLPGKWGLLYSTPMLVPY